MLERRCSLRIGTYLALAKPNPAASQWLVGAIVLERGMPGYSKILLIVDAQTDKKLLNRLAPKLAGRETRWIVLGVIPELHAPSFKRDRTSTTAQAIEKQLLDRLKAKVAKIAESLRGDVSTQIVSGRFVDEAVGAALIHEPDLVLKIADIQPGDKPPILGSADKKLIRKCPSPVMIVRPDIGEALDRIAIAVARDDDAKQSIVKQRLNRGLAYHASQIARIFGLKAIHVVHAWSAIGAEIVSSARAGLSPEAVREYMEAWEDESHAWLEDYTRAMQKEFGGENIRFRERLVHGLPPRAIVDAVNNLEADILVMGTIGRSGAPGLLIGNTAEEILDRVQCSVFAVKPPGFLSPVVKPKKIRD